VFIYERVIVNQSEQEKYKLKLIGCIRLGEIVTNAIVGGTSSSEESSQEESKKGNKEMK
jgi:hypothetical protein